LLAVDKQVASKGKISQCKTITKERVLYMLKLVKPTEIWEAKFKDYIRDWVDNGETPVPAITKYKKVKYEKWLWEIFKRSDPKLCKKTVIPAHTFFLVKETFDNWTDNTAVETTIIGLIEVRHNLSKKTYRTSGHIDYGIRPSERGKGYGKTIIKLALDLARKLGIKKAVLCVKSDNVPSKKIIERAGGIYQDYIIDKKGKIDRYFVILCEELLAAEREAENKAIEPNVVIELQAAEKFLVEHIVQKNKELEQAARRAVSMTLGQPLEFPIVQSVEQVLGRKGESGESENTGQGVEKTTEQAEQEIGKAMGQVAEQEIGKAMGQVAEQEIEQSQIQAQEVSEQDDDLPEITEPFSIYLQPEEPVTEVVEKEPTAKTDKPVAKKEPVKEKAKEPQTEINKTKKSKPEVKSKPEPKIKPEPKAKATKESEAKASNTERQSKLEQARKRLASKPKK